MTSSAPEGDPGRGMDVGFLGLGAMGHPMASNLARAGHRVVGWNRGPVQAPAGVELLGTPAEVAERARATVVMVSDAAAVRAVLFGDQGWLQGARAGDVVVLSSTVGPAEMRAIAGDLAQRGMRVVDAPVSGSVGPAEQGALTVLAGGDDALLDSLAWLFEPLAKAVLRCGPVGAGSAVKLVVNATLVSVLAAAGEALTWLVDAEPDASVEAVTQALQRVSPLAAARVPALVGRPPDGQFRLGHVVKDLRLVVDAMAPAPVLQAALDAARGAAEQGYEDADVSALGAAARARRQPDR